MRKDTHNSQIYQTKISKVFHRHMRGTAAERQRGIGNVRSDIGEVNVYN